MPPRISTATPAEIVAFHAAHQYLLLAHSPAHCARLDRLVAVIKAVPRGAWLDRYAEGFMQALAVRATPRKHVNVLWHMMGSFKSRLSADSKRELLGLIADYARGLVPLIVPITLINHHVTRFGIAYRADQIYLAPPPEGADA